MEGRWATPTAVGTNKYAGVAQLEEQLICNQWVGGSSPSASSSLFACGFEN